MITKNFIKQCEVNEDLQEEWEQTVGDIYIYERDIESGCYFYITEHKKHMNAIWLPTLEQLFEMVDWDNYKIAKCKKEYFCWCADLTKVFNAELGDHYLLFEFESIQEVILSIVMKEKYHKVWTGEKWEEVK